MMKHIVSFETAKALKAAGYPQPEFAMGQVWYNNYGAKTAIGRKHVSEELPHEVSFDCFSVDSGRSERISPIHEGAFYAPSATEIMEQTCMLYCDLYYRSINWRCSEHGGRRTENKNPAEAAAELWLKLKQNETKTN